MRQIFQNLRSGDLLLEDVPAPLAAPGHVLVQSRRSLISAGTERMLVEFGRASLLAKARQQPERVKQVLEKIKTDGLLPTLEAVFARLDEPLPLGYCNAGVVLEAGGGVSQFRPGDRVVTNGPHAEVVLAPETLCAKVPEGVSDEEAAFTPLAAVALQAIRLLDPQLGERVVVIGLGLVGLLAMQLLRANGCQVLGIDFNSERVALAEGLGLTGHSPSSGADPVAAALSFSGGRGVDGVIIAASTASSDPVHQAAQMCRQRGRIVLAGVTGLELSRADFYQKELTFQVSCSYGPGRYDPQYEERATDYPFGFVRWTAQRNFEAVLTAMADGDLRVSPLITHRLPWAEAAAAYDTLTKDSRALGVVLEYPAEAAPMARTVSMLATQVAASKAVIGLIGAGTFARLTMLPALAPTGARLRAVASAGGASAQQLAKKFGFEVATSDYRELLSDPAVNLVLIATRHHQHARMVLEALQAGKHVFVEKPLCLTREELEQIRAAHAAAGDRLLLVGFNRRFAPHVEKMRALLAGRTEPLAMTMLVNAGVLPADHWLQDPRVGGGRLVGEGVHFLDLLRYLAGAPITSVSAQALEATRTGGVRGESSVVTLAFADGSVGTVQYYANGDRGFPKERLEVFCGGRVLALDNFRMLRGYGWQGFGKLALRRQDKGHRAQFARVIESVERGGAPLLPFAEIEEVTRASFDAAEQVGAR